MKYLHGIKTLLNRFWPNTDGNIAMTTAVGGLCITSVVGLAVDMSGARSFKQELQSHLDVVSLAVAISGINEPEGQITLAKEILKAHGYEIPDSDLNIQMKPNGEVSVTGRVDYLNAFAGVWGKDKTPVVAQSIAIAGVGSVSDPTDIVLVLDTTDSMAGAKLTALQSSANKLIDILSMANNNQVQIGLVPFSGYINVGIEHRDAFWIDVEPDSIEVKTEYEQILVSAGYCQGNPNATWTKYDDGVPTTYTGCDNYVDAVYEDGAAITTTSEQTWEGCVMFRSQGDGSSGIHLRDSNYNNEPVPGYPKGDWNCGNKIVPLTTQLQNVSASINAIETDWNTYMPGGIAWGWRVLSPHEPFTGGRSDSKQIMVLMTDGVNSMAKMGRAVGPKDPSDPEDAAKLEITNQDTTTLCQNVKNDDIELYTIAFEVSDFETKRMLSSCASSSSHYFDAGNASQLEDAFLEIAGNITAGVEARLTR